MRFSIWLDESLRAMRRSIAPILMGHNCNDHIEYLNYDGLVYRYKCSVCGTIRYSGSSFPTDCVDFYSLIKEK